MIDYHSHPNHNPDPLHNTTTHINPSILLFYSSIVLEGLEQLHPEGPNIGYNSNSSWFDNKQTSDSDNILSQTKGALKRLFYCTVDAGGQDTIDDTVLSVFYNIILHSIII